MSIPVSTIQPPQIVNSQPKANIAANTTTVTAPLPAKKLAPTEGEKTNDKNDSMKLAKSPIGVIEPPQDTYKFSIHDKVKETQEATKDILDFSSPLSATGIGGESKKHVGIFPKLLMGTAALVGIIFAVKKFKLSSLAPGNISNITELKTHITEVVNLSKKGSLKPFNAKKASLRLIDESADNIKDALNSIRNITTEARNIEGKTPKVIIKLKETAVDSPKIIKNAFKGNNIDSLSETTLKDIEYINLEYVSSDKKNTDVLVNTIKSNFVDSSKSQSNFWDKTAKFLKGFLGD